MFCIFAQFGITRLCFSFALKAKLYALGVADWGHHLLSLYKINRCSRKEIFSENSIDSHSRFADRCRHSSRYQNSTGRLYVYHLHSSCFEHAENSRHQKSETNLLRSISERYLIWKHLLEMWGGSVKSEIERNLFLISDTAWKGI